jgi:hypothetical protein
LTGLEPAADAVEVEGMVANSCEIQINYHLVASPSPQSDIAKCNFKSKQCQESLEIGTMTIFQERENTTIDKCTYCLSMEKTLRKLF